MKKLLYPIHIKINVYFNILKNGYSTRVCASADQWADNDIPFVGGGVGDASVYISQKHRPRGVASPTHPLGQASTGTLFSPSFVQISPDLPCFLADFSKVASQFGLSEGALPSFVQISPRFTMFFG